jgi:hypothetical protein
LIIEREIFDWASEKRELRAFFHLLPDFSLPARLLASRRFSEFRSAAGVQFRLLEVAENFFGAADDFSG